MNQSSGSYINSSELMQNPESDSWKEYLDRYASGEERAVIFRDMVLADAFRLKGLSEDRKVTMLDIGCGGGFDHKSKLQATLAEAASHYIGVEPDTEIQLDKTFAETHRCFFEEADITSSSVSVAFSVMVLEHVANPVQFWGKVYDVLQPGGVFWGFTVDARHWFVSASTLIERLGLKNRYLTLLHGKRGEQRYENYGVEYKCNSPEQVAELTSKFSSVDVINFNKIGQLDYYFPKALQWAPRLVDRVNMKLNRPGSVIAIRVVK